MILISIMKRIYNQ